MKTLVNKKAFTLVEIIVVLVIMGFLSALVMPSFRNTINNTKASLNKTQMHEIKRASLKFYNDLGFVADNVSLLIYPWQNCISEEEDKCTVGKSSYDNEYCSDTCINMIAFIDKHYKFTTTAPALRIAGIGDNGHDTQRTPTLIDIIKEKLNPDKGWEGSYIGGNEIIKNKNLIKLGVTSLEDENIYYFTDHDIKVYDAQDYNSLYEMDSTKWIDSEVANKELYPIFAENFNGNRHTSGTSKNINMDKLYENAKYSKGTTRKTTFLGAMTILDPYGTPYEIQIPTVDAVSDYKAIHTNASEVRTTYARIVSFGKDRRRDTDINTLDIDYTESGYDDSVLYIFNEHGLQNYFYPEDEEK